MDISKLPQVGFTSSQSVASHQVDDLQRAVDQGKKEEAGQAFESLLATQLVREMRRSLPSGLFGGGAGSDVYESWFDRHLGQALADREALGFAGMIKASLKEPDPLPGEVAVPQEEVDEA